MSKGLPSPKLSEIDFRVVKPIGAGAGSTILLISDKATSKRYALKVVKRQGAEDDIYINQAIHEFDVLNRLNHPAIVRGYDCRVRRKWLRTSGVELLMEYVEGDPLDGAGPLDLKQQVRVFNRVADGLIHMHRRGVYHGDLKPMNIMLAKTGEAKIIDFGTAWIKGEDKGRVQGTPQYMAPEQATEKIVDERTDLYNFGATMYRMLTGEYANAAIPGVGSGGFKLKIQPPIDIDPTIPGTLNETIVACLQASRERRPANATEVKYQLAAVARYLGIKPEAPEGLDEPA